MSAPQIRPEHGIPAEMYDGTSAPAHTAHAASTGEACPATPPAMVVSDLDGTLLDPDKRVSRRNAEALARAARAGAKVLIATGRPAYHLEPVADAGFTGLAVCANGAVVYDIGADRTIDKTLIEPAAMRRFASEVTELGFDITVAVERAGVGARDFWAEPAYRHPWDDVDTKRAPWDELFAVPAVKLLVRYTGPPDTVLDAARAVSAGRVTVTDSSGDGLLEVAAAGVTKGATLARLAHDWQIDAADVVAFGDMPNDVEMLRWAGRSVAMGNAHPDVRAAAREVGPDHADDGVAQILERWF